MKKIIVISSVLLIFLCSSLTVFAKDSYEDNYLVPSPDIEQPSYEDFYFKGKSTTYSYFSKNTSNNSVFKMFYISELQKGTLTVPEGFYFLKIKSTTGEAFYTYRPYCNGSDITYGGSYKADRFFYNFDSKDTAKGIFFDNKTTIDNKTLPGFLSSDGIYNSVASGGASMYFFKTSAPIFDSVEAAQAYFKNGDNSGLVNNTPELDKSLIIRDLDVEENKDLGVLKSAVLTWSPSKYANFPSSNLTVEIKIDGQVLNKNNTVAKELANEVIFASVSKKDSFGTYTLDMDALKKDLVSKHGLNSANVGGLKVTDYFCRYAFNGVTFGNWQKVGDYDPNLGDATLDKSLGVVSNLNFKMNKEIGSKKAILTWLPKTSSVDNLRIEACFLGRVINKQNGQVVDFAKKNKLFDYPDGVKDSLGSYEFDYNKVTYDWLESLDYSTLSPVTPQITNIIVRYIKMNDDYTYSYGSWTSFKIKHGVIIDGKFVETPLTDGIFGDDTFWTEKTDDVTVKTDKDGNTIIDDSGKDNVTTDNNGNIIVDGTGNNDLSDIGNISDIFFWFVKQFNGLASSIKVVPQMLGSVAMWIPSPIIVLICLGMSVAILLRILGR